MSSLAWPKSILAKPNLAKDYKCGMFKIYNLLDQTFFKLDFLKKKV